ncbi:hypothetical protein [Nocardia sp. NPDC127526]|uniref:hypothetical protein n=1 Tax=Nocardia sp. NPDC127526 TaxID=3345393 RepID=UPI0036381DD1
MRLVRGVSGVVAGGVVVLAATVIGAEIIGIRRGFPGPGWDTVAWHTGAALAVSAAQIFADRRRGFASFSGSMVVFLIAGYLLWAQWWN